MTLTHKINSALLGAALALCVPTVQADKDSRVRVWTCDAEHTLTQALRHVESGDTLLVSGICQENVVIPAELHRITLDGQGAAAINGPDATRGTIEIRATGVVVKGFTVTGGLNGIDVANSASATVDGNVIQQTGRDGIHVSRASSAIIVNNTIENNAENGIHVSESSAARIGFRGSNPLTVAEPNIIQNNAGRGIRVTRSSSGRIYGNSIRNNGNSGIDVRRAAFADISSNQIDGNAGDGILVNQNSAVVLGADVTEDPVSDNPNSTTVPNTSAGVRCGTNSSADGRRGTLTGSIGAVNFDFTCVNSLIP